MNNAIQKLNWLGALVLACAGTLVSCSPSQGPQRNTESETQGWLPWVKNEPINILKTESGDDIPERVYKFLESAEQFGTGVRTYRWGSCSRNVADCSGFLGQAHRAAGYQTFFYQFDRDPINFSGCTGQLRAGDVLLLGYSGGQPDHWIMMADVRAPNGQFNHPDNIIMDVSSDYVDGKPFFKGPLSRRKNLLARKVFACRRHRSFERDWKQMLVQLEESRKVEESKTEPTDAQTDDTSESNARRPLMPL